MRDYTGAMKPKRAAWADAFPDVRILAPESGVKRHPDYPSAKTGDAEAAGRLVEALVRRDAIDELKLALPPGAILASVHAVEATGVNAIPEALANLLGLRLGLQVDASIVQTNVVNHTGADGFGRLARQALFAGDVQHGASYVIVDDFVGQGGTMANLRGYLLEQGATVARAVALTGKPHSAKIQLSPQRLAALRSKHGQLEDWWRERFGFGFDALTESEARYLERTENADTVRDRISAAEQAGDG